MKLNNLTDNPLSREWKKRYNEQPAEIRRELDRLDTLKIEEYQLKVIKRKRIQPEKGDVFLLSPREGLYFYGLVVNSKINNMDGDNLSVILIFRDKAKSVEDVEFTPDVKRLLLRPDMVGREYWTRGYFYNIGRIKEEIFQDFDYGFYDIFREKYYDEYGKELTKRPALIGLAGVSTVSGIAAKINRELIIDSSLAEPL